MSTPPTNRAATLYAHVVALERLQEAKDEARDDYNMRMKLAVEDDFDRRAITAILKRRKTGPGPSEAFDENVREYEDMIRAASTAPLAPETVNPAGCVPPAEEGTDF